MGTLNIFTDASIIKTDYGETIGCSGAICLENNNISKYEITRDSTNNIAEITAVLLAVQLAIENRDKFDVVNIWADSQWSIFGLTKWIRSWINNMDNFIMYNSSGDPVKNQQLFGIIIRLITDSNLRVNFYHIKGHVDPRNISSVQNAVNVFERSNGCSISRDKIYHAINMNNLVDKTTRDLLQKYKKEDRLHLNRWVVMPILTPQIMDKYYSLVTLGNNKI